MKTNLAEHERLLKSLPRKAFEPDKFDLTPGQLGTLSDALTLQLPESADSPAEILYVTERYRRLTVIFEYDGRFLGKLVNMRGEESFTAHFCEEKLEDLNFDEEETNHRYLTAYYKRRAYDEGYTEEEAIVAWPEAAAYLRGPAAGTQPNESSRSKISYGDLGPTVDPDWR